MGTEMCCKSRKTLLREGFKEFIPLFTQAVSISSVFDTFETNYNLFQYMDIEEFFLLLNVYNQANLNANNNKSLTLNYFIDFIDDSIFKSDVISNYIDYNEQLKLIFRDFLQYLFEYLVEIFKHGNDRNLALNKDNLAVIGILYSKDNLDSKVNSLYTLLMNEKGVIVKNKKVNDFFYLLLLIASIGSLNCLKSITEIYRDNFEVIIDQEFDLINNSLTLSELVNIRNELVNDFFREQEELNLKEFKENFYNNYQYEFAWIFNAKEIRQYIEKEYNTGPHNHKNY